MLCTGNEEYEDEEEGVETSEDVEFESLNEMEKRKLMMMQSGEGGVWMGGLACDWSCDWSDD